MGFIGVFDDSCRDSRPDIKEKDSELDDLELDS